MNTNYFKNMTMDSWLLHIPSEIIPLQYMFLSAFLTLGFFSTWMLHNSLRLISYLHDFLLSAILFPILFNDTTTTQTIKAEIQQATYIWSLSTLSVTIWKQECWCGPRVCHKERRAIGWFTDSSNLIEFLLYGSQQNRQVGHPAAESHLAHTHQQMSAM
jgi:hypothetical protein